MSAPRAVLEILDSHGTLVARARVDALPLTIGRSVACDIVVDDPYLDATHVRIVEDGTGLVAEDAESVNGLRAGRSNERVARVPLVRGTELHAGRTTIRYLDPSAPVPPARRDRAAAWHAPLAEASWLNSRRARAGAVVACLFAFGLDKYLENFEPKVAPSVASMVLGGLIVLVLWAGLWSLGARLARHPALFTQHLAIGGLAFAGILVLAFCEQWALFLWPNGKTTILSSTLSLALIIVAFHAHLGLASSWRRWWRWGIAAAIPLALAGIIVLIGSKDDGVFSTKMKWESQVKSMRPASVPASSVQALTGDIDAARAEVDKAAAKAATTK